MGPYSTKNLIINWDYEGVPLSTSPILKLLLELSMSANNFGGENSTKTRIIGRIKPGMFDAADCPAQLLSSAQSVIPSATAITIKWVFLEKNGKLNLIFNLFSPSKTSIPVSGTRAASTTSNVCKDVRQQQEASGFPVLCLLAVVRKISLFGFQKIFVPLGCCGRPHQGLNALKMEMIGDDNQFVMCRCL